MTDIITATPTVPGMYYGLDNEAYHAGTHAVSNSMLRDFAISPLHCYARHFDPKRPPRKVKAGQLEGSLAHCALLEPDQFSKRYPIGPTANRNTKVWKEFAEGCLPHETPIQQDQADVAFAQARSLRAIPDVGTLLARGHAEVSVYWIDEETGLLCRCRPDWRWMHPDREDAVMLLDAKTYSDASPSEFSRQVARKAYYAQAAWYSDGYAKATGHEVLGFVFGTVETEFPYAASACTLDESSLAKGRSDNRALLTAYAKCMSTGVWPGYSEAIEVISLPTWMTNQPTPAT
jgi:exodeoxyribonuclease VIII